MEDNKSTTIAILSYKHSGAREPYAIDGLDGLEVNVPAENVLAATYAYAQALQLVSEGAQDVSIMTLGGCAQTNAEILTKLMEKDEESRIRIIAEPAGEEQSYSIPSNLKKLVELAPERSEFIVFCQYFARLRAFLHSRFYLQNRQFSLTSWEESMQDCHLNENSQRVVEEVVNRTNIPLTAKLSEFLLTPLAFLDPETGTWIIDKLAHRRKQIRELNPQDPRLNNLP